VGWGGEDANIDGVGIEPLKERGGVRKGRAGTRGLGDGEVDVGREGGDVVSDREAWCRIGDLF